ncbi:MAG TPA: hypothetical protein VGP43_03550 [Chitinophagaceae bacterium]|nr:hypothetical protein [Chitinophagaceae bacterium]
MKIIVITLFSVLLLGCINKKHIPLNKDIEDVVTACIINKLGNDSAARYYYKLMPPAMYKDKPILKKYYDSIESILDTAKIYIVLPDILKPLNQSEKHDVSFAIKETSIKNEFKILLQNLTQGTSEINIDLHYIQKILKYNVRANDSSFENIARIGFLEFTIPKFNAAKTKAVIYLNFYCGSKCGTGDIFILEKLNNNWIVIKDYGTWIS